MGMIGEGLLRVAVVVPFLPLVVYINPNGPRAANKATCRGELSTGRRSELVSFRFETFWASRLCGWL